MERAEEERNLLVFNILNEIQFDCHVVSVGGDWEDRIKEIMH